MLTEINGVLKSGQIPPERFYEIQQQATTLDQLQRKFGPPPTISQAADTRSISVDTSRPLTIKVMNRGVKDAAAVLRHYGWHFSQIRGVLKPAFTAPNNLDTLLQDLKRGRHGSLYPWSKSRQRKSTAFLKALIVLFWFGGFMFVAISLILQLL